MTSAPISRTVAALQQRRRIISYESWVWLGTLTVLFIAVFSNYLDRLFRIVTHARGDNPIELIFSAMRHSWNPDWSHALVVPFIGLYYIYQQRQRIARTRPRVFLWGLPLVFAGLFSYVFWIYPGRNDMFQGYSMILTLFGAALFMLGPSMMRVLWFPILYLGFSVKIADALWSHIAWKLQQFAAMAATFFLKFFALVFDFNVAYRGSTIDLSVVHNGAVVTNPLNVAEACSGLRSLMAFIALGTALAFLWKRVWWQRLIMIAATVPIAIAVNVARVAVIGLIYLVNPNYAQGDFHIFVGLLMLIPAAGLFVLLGWILDRIIIYEETDAAPARPPHGGERTSVRATAPPSTSPSPAQGEDEGGDVDTHAFDGSGEKASRPAQTSTTIVAGVVLSVLVGLASFVLRGLDQSNWLIRIIANPYGAAALAAAGWGLAYLRPRMAGGVAVGCVLALLIGCVYGLLLNLVAAAPIMAGLTGATGGAVLALLVLAVGVIVWLVMKLLRRPMDGSLRRRYALPVGIIAGILLASLTGQQAVIAATRTVLIKRPVPLRHSLVLIPSRVGDWKLVREDPPLSAAVLETLGTDKYISRVYKDTTWPEGKPGGLARLHVGYYTGTTDTVPHVPDRCFVAGGAQPVALSTTTVALTGKDYHRDAKHGGYLHPLKRHGAPQRPARVPSLKFPATLFTYADPNTERKRNVVYFFAVNGKFLDSPNQVRLHGFDPRDKYAYYCKIEVQLFGVADPDLARQRASALLSDMLPQIMACLPDWVQVKKGQWPPDQRVAGPAGPPAAESAAEPATAQR